MNKTTIRKKHYVNGKAVVNSLVSDVGKGIASDAGKHWEQFLGINKSGSHEASGDLVEGQELNLSLQSANQPQEKTEAKLDIEPGIAYHRDIIPGSISNFASV